MKELIYEELLLLYFLDIVGSFSNLNLWSVSNIWSISSAIVLPKKKKKKKKSAIVQVNSNCFIYIKVYSLSQEIKQPTKQKILVCFYISHNLFS